MRGYDLSVLEFPFTFWQYGGACESVPGPEGDAITLASYMSWYTDEAMLGYEAYYWQSATQLGGPAYPQEHLADLPGWPIVDDPADFPPRVTPKPWDAGEMRKVGSWVRTNATRILFVYGELDPWSTHMFEPNPGRDVRRYVIAGGNHSAGISNLPEPARNEALATVARWAEVEFVAGGVPGVRAAPPEEETRWLREGEPGLGWNDRWSGSGASSRKFPQSGEQSTPPP